MIAWMHDLRYALKVLRKRPLYACLTVLVFAIAIGANTTGRAARIDPMRALRAD